MCSSFEAVPWRPPLAGRFQVGTGVGGARAASCGGWPCRAPPPPPGRMGAEGHPASLLPRGKSALCRPSPPPSPARRLLVGRVAASGVPHPVPPDCGSNPRCIFKCISPRNVGAWQDEGVSYSFAYKKQLKHDFYEQSSATSRKNKSPAHL